MNGIDVSGLRAFNNIHIDNQNAIINKGANGDYKQNGTYTGILSALSRSKEERAANNEVRTLLLQSLGKALGMDATEKDGKITFSKTFMDRLESIFGADFKRSDFGINDKGEVSSGKPLTQRRITVILNKAIDEGILNRGATETFSADKCYKQFNSLMNEINDAEPDTRFNLWNLNNIVNGAIGLLKNCPEGCFKFDETTNELLCFQTRGKRWVPVKDSQDLISAMNNVLREATSQFALSGSPITGFFAEKSLPQLPDDPAEKVKMLNEIFINTLQSFVMATIDKLIMDGTPQAGFKSIQAMAIQYKEANANALHLADFNQILNAN